MTSNLVVRLFRNFAAISGGFLFSCLVLAQSPRTRENFDANWRFIKDDPAGVGDALSYPKIKEWLLPTGTDFLEVTTPVPKRPDGNLGGDIAYVQPGFNDQTWRKLDLPHDW